MTDAKDFLRSKKDELVNFFKKLFSGRKKFIVLPVLLLLLGFFAWRILAKKEEKPQYQTNQVERGTIISSVS
ncbi:MAG TPA: hypothetical protein VMW41_06885, partial [Candidatus Bathyarchaeia archaeon]|nr:hypothetical protein [Candidatus Bathyarchaeia archaeon]